jgi:membrane protein
MVLVPQGGRGTSPWRDVARRIRREIKEGRSSIMAGGVAFYGFLALLPALAALVSIYGLVADPRDVQSQMDALAALVPQQVREVMQAELTSLVGRSTGELCVEAVVSIVLALWAANKGTRALMIAVGAVFDAREATNIVRINFIALLLTVSGILFGVVALAMVVAVPALLGRLGLSSAPLVLAAWLRWPVLAAVLLLGLAIVYRYSRVRPPARMRWISAGSVTAAVLWLAGSALFSWFVSSYTTFNRLDGSIAAFAILLSWFLLSAYVVILGAAVDAEVDAFRRGRRGHLL